MNSKEFATLQEAVDEATSTTKDISAANTIVLKKDYEGAGAKVKDGYTGDLKFDFGNFTLEPTSEVNFNKAAVVLVAGKDGGLDTDAVVTSLNSITLDAAFKGKFDAKLTLTDATFTVDTQSAEIEFESLTASGTASVAVNTSVLVEVEAYGADTTADVFKPKEGVETNIATDIVADGKAYKTLAEAIAAKPENIKLLKDVDVSETIAVTGTVTLDANGKTISNTTDLWDTDNNNWSLFSVRGEGNLTVTGNGSFLAKKDDCYAFDVQDAGAKLTIESGTAKGNISVVYVTEGEATIQGGEYSIQQLNEQNPYAFTLNLLDESNTAGTAKITVTGGKFYKFDPAASEGENPVANFVADGYQSVQDGDWYVVSAK